MRLKQDRGWSDVDSAEDVVDAHAAVRRSKYQFEDESDEGKIPSPWSIADWRRDAAHISVVEKPKNTPKERLFGTFDVSTPEQQPKFLTEHSIYHGLALLMLGLSFFLMCTIVVLLLI